MEVDGTYPVSSLLMSFGVNGVHCFGSAAVVLAIMN